MAKCAFIGLGIMGYPMAGHLQAKGHEVCVYNRTAEKAEAWAGQHGGRTAPTPRQAAEGAEFVLMGLYLFFIYVIARPFGAAAQAGFGIGMRVLQAGFMPMVALGIAVAPVAGQNFGARHPERMIGLHLTMAAPPVDPATLTPEQRVWWDELQRYREREWGYVHLQRTKPQTPAFALTDSPAGLAAWILEKWWRWSDCEDEHGGRDLLRAYTRDELLTTVTIYWVTRTIGPSMRMYRESFGPGAVIDRVTTAARCLADEGTRWAEQWGEQQK